MFTVKISGAKEMISDLRRMREKAIPHALKNALTSAAFETRSIWQREVRSAFTNRNTFTANSIRVEQASTTKLEATVGSTAPYMGKQETGGSVTGKGGRKPIPGPVAAGQAPGGKRVRLVRAGFRLGAIHTKHPALKGDRKQRNAIAIAVAVRSGTKRAVLERPGGGKALFIIGGRAKAPITRLLWNVSRSSVRVPATPTLELALAAVRPKMQHTLEAALLEQLRRHGIAGY